MTGSWYGGAFVGAMLGLLVVTGIDSTKPTQDPQAREADEDNK